MAYQCWELTLGEFSLGSSIYTNDGETASDNINDLDATSLIWKKNKRDGYGGWKDGRVYSSPLWIGIRSGSNISRFGYSHRIIQDLTQNGLHQSSVFKFGNQNYYLNYRYFREKFYFGGGVYNSYTLY